VEAVAAEGDEILEVAETTLDYFSFLKVVNHFRADV
jgi:hypothetical protein